MIDSQSVRTSETGGTKGYNAGKKILGLKRHIIVDASGRLLCACVSPADMHDSRDAPDLLRASRRSWPFIGKIWADAAYRGERVGAATSIQIEIVTGPANQRGFIAAACKGLRTISLYSDRLRFPRRRVGPDKTYQKPLMSSGQALRPVSAISTEGARDLRRASMTGPSAPRA